MKLLNWINSFFNKTDKNKTRRALTDDQFNELKYKREKKLNAILDKISKSGYDNLSTHEKNFLKNYKSDYISNMINKKPLIKSRVFFTN